MRRIFITAALTVILLPLIGQDRKIIKADMLWLGYFNSVRVSERFSVNSDAQVRTRNSLWYNYLLRSGWVYKINNKLFGSAGLATFFYPQINDQNLLRTELRPWEELMLADFIGKIKVSHRFRAEQRFNQVIAKNSLTDDFAYNNRFRYKVDLQIPIFRNEKLSHVISITLANEIMINTGKIIKYNYFDQDRLAIGFNYQANPAFTFQLQLMHIWQQQSNGYTLENDNVLRLNIYHSIYFKKNADTTK